MIDPQWWQNQIQRNMILLEKHDIVEAVIAGKEILPCGSL